MTSRRRVLKGLAATPLATLLADTQLAHAAAETLDTVNIATPMGMQISGALAMPDGDAKGGVLLVHEWWGLNDQIKTVAAEFAKNGYVTLAADLYKGEVTDSPDEARALSGAVDATLATETLVAWVEWLRAHPDTGGSVATVGWCFGGSWSLNASIAAPVDATVIYYGQCDKSEMELANLKGPVLGHFATQDQWITKDMVTAFETSMNSSGKAYQTHWYEADHAFANPTTARYDEEDAKLSFQRTLDFLAEHLQG